MEMIAVVVNITLYPIIPIGTLHLGLLKTRIYRFYKARQYKWLILLIAIFCPFVQLLISSFAVKAFLQNLKHLSTGKIAQPVPQAESGWCYPYRIFPYLLSLQVSINMTGEKGH